eukprot:gnl/TRDRNA2_/TRDRNA2_196117_c0_seq1.p1 gnl/TRDRNA2_/TRDRNA2_196117_c0~~gnl/TRDRNA2_/TRDRNA2_196117_c0_seq1.p1  ORF type:complete len:239 (-),score=46.56 gnl/TRDRNA2_/TRDRNA2_196117_c0_seq1:121-837(-)
MWRVPWVLLAWVSMCCAEREVTPAMAVQDEAMLAKFLDAGGAEVTDVGGQTVVHWAASAGNLDAIEAALRRGANPVHADVEGRTPLHIAALSGHVPAVAQLLAAASSLLDDHPASKAAASARDATGATPLHRAALAGSAGAVRALARAAPASVNARLPRTGGTALHAAAYLGHAPVLEALLEAGASRCVRNKEGDLPIETYVQEDDDDVARIYGELPVVDDESRARVVELLRSPESCP